MSQSYYSRVGNGYDIIAEKTGLDRNFVKRSCIRQAYDPGSISCERVLFDMLSEHIRQTAIRKAMTAPYGGN